MSKILTCLCAFFLLMSTAVAKDWSEQDLGDLSDVNALFLHHSTGEQGAAEDVPHLQIGDGRGYVKDIESYVWGERTSTFVGEKVTFSFRLQQERNAVISAVMYSLIGKKDPDYNCPTVMLVNGVEYDLRPDDASNKENRVSKEISTALPAGRNTITIQEKHCVGYADANNDSLLISAGIGFPPKK